MAQLIDPQTSKLVQAIEQFMENPPQDLPQGLPEQLKELGTSLRGYGGEGDESPGMKEAMKATNGTGESYKLAGTGKDVPSPGQREFDKHMEAAREAFHAQNPESQTNPVETQ
jgi:hypothetical protein